MSKPDAEVTLAACLGLPRLCSSIPRHPIQLAAVGGDQLTPLLDNKTTVSVIPLSSRAVT